MASSVARIFKRSKSKPESDFKSSSTITSENDVKPQQKAPCPLMISRLYNDAGEFEKVLLFSGCINAEGVCPKGSTGFADLIGHDLSHCERAYVDRDARVCALNKAWVPPTLAQRDPNPTHLEGDEELGSTTSFSPKPETPPPILRDSLAEIDPHHLDAKDIVNILIQEFGALTGPGDEEMLLLEADGLLLHDVAIVGVIHLTTRRLAFHASLLSTRPDLASSHGVIKSGPAILHRKGWRTKRRIWLELSHDMLSAYASSQEDERTRPLCTLLLTFVKNVRPVDLKHPRILRLSVDSSAAKTHNDCAEFDTEESAEEWRKEISGAIFNYRYLRKELCTSPSDSSGVKISCPLKQIVGFNPTDTADFSSVMSFTVRSSNSDFQFENEDVPEFQVLNIGPFKSVMVWQNLGSIILTAKKRQHLGDSDLQCPVFVDFGKYNFFEKDDNSNFMSSTQLSASDETAVRCALGFPPDCELWVFRARIFRNVVSSGYFAVSRTHLGFWSKYVTQKDVRYRLPLTMVRYAKPYCVNWLNVEGVKIGIVGKPDANFVFKSTSVRDEVIQLINESIKHSRHTDGSLLAPVLERDSSDSLGSEEGESILPIPISAEPQKDPVDIFAPLSRSLAATKAASMDLPYAVRKRLPKVINLPREVLVTRKRLHFVCLTIGSRGDVQPYIALGLRLRQEGHRVTVVTHEEYSEWIKGYGLGHRTAGGDPGALMKLSVENKMFSPEFFRQSLTKFRPWLDQLLIESWEACHDAEVLLESPSAMAGVHIAEALNIPYFRTFTMPWTKTTEFPHALLSPPVDSPTFNSASYVLYSNVIWAATAKQINKWRRHALKLSNTDMGHLAQSKITFIYNFSRVVVPKPLDWPDTTILSGYWFLENPDLGWEPPQDLLDWMNKARADGKPIVYIGFGSIIVPHPNKVTAAIVKAVVKSDVRAVLSKGWSSRMNKEDTKYPAVDIPPECYLVDKVPHDWIFPRVDAALHHGGAGTTGASLRAGIPTLIKPWFGDQFFWASRVHSLGAGMKVPSLHVDDLVHALTKATQDEKMKIKAMELGEQIRKEDGVHTAIYTIYTYLHRAGQARSSL